MNTKDRHNQQGKKKAAEEALKANNHEEAYRLYNEAMDVDKHNAKYRHLLREAKQQHLQATRADYYEVLGVEKTCGESDIKKAYFKKSKEYHPDKHASANDEEREIYSNKFKLAKEAYEILSDMEKRKVYDRGVVKPPPGGWYQDIDKRILRNIKPRGGFAARGRGVVHSGRGRASIVLGPSLSVQAMRGRGTNIPLGRGIGGKGLIITSQMRGTNTRPIIPSRGNFTRGRGPSCASRDNDNSTVRPTMTKVNPRMTRASKSKNVSTG